MSAEIITKEDLQQFRIQLLEELKNWVASLKQSQPEHLEGLKTKHVRQILNCSTGKLHLLRSAGKLRVKKVGGTVYYRREDIKKLVEEGF